MSEEEVGGAQKSEWNNKSIIKHRAQRRRKITQTSTKKEQTKLSSDKSSFSSQFILFGYLDYVRLKAAECIVFVNVSLSVCVRALVFAIATAALDRSKKHPLEASDNDALLGCLSIFLLLSKSSCDMICVCVCFLGQR